MDSKLQSRSPHSSGEIYNCQISQSGHVLKFCYTHENVVLHLLDPPFLFGGPSLTLNQIKLLLSMYGSHSTIILYFRVL